MEVLVHILSFLPKKDRKDNCRFVNKVFYDATGMLDDVRTLLLLTFDDFVSFSSKF